MRVGGELIAMGGARDLRASDEDRERVAQALRQHYGAGRLNTDEFEARLSGAYDAVTLGDLAALTRDLPQVAPAGGEAPGAKARAGKGAASRALGAWPIVDSPSPASLSAPSSSRAESHALALRETRDAMGRRALQNGGRRLVVFGGCTAIWAVTGGFFWPVFVLIYTLVIAARSYLALYGPSPDVARIERELSRRRRRETKLALRRHGQELGDLALGWWITQNAAKQAASAARRRERRREREHWHDQDRDDL